MLGAISDMPRGVFSSVLLPLMWTLLADAIATEELRREAAGEPTLRGLGLLPRDACDLAAFPPCATRRAAAADAAGAGANAECRIAIDVSRVPGNPNVSRLLTHLHRALIVGRLEEEEEWKKQANQALFRAIMSYGRSTVVLAVAAIVRAVRRVSNASAHIVRFRVSPGQDVGATVVALDVAVPWSSVASVMRFRRYFLVAGENSAPLRAELVANVHAEETERASIVTSLSRMTEEQRVATLTHPSEDIVVCTQRSFEMRRGDWVGFRDALRAHIAALGP